MCIFYIMRLIYTKYLKYVISRTIFKVSGKQIFKNGWQNAEIAGKGKPTG